MEKKMSLPTYACFVHNDEIIHREFINAGWFLSEEILLECVIDALTKYHEALEYQDFDYMHLYSHDFSIIDLIDWKHKEITNKELLVKSLQNFKTRVPK
jgi:hypothetical protein